MRLPRPCSLQLATAIFLGSSSCSAHAYRIRASDLEADTGSCATCADDLAMDLTWGIEMKIFPPEPKPNYIQSFLCAPFPQSAYWRPRKGRKSLNVSVAMLERACGGPEIFKDLSESDKKKCLETAAYMDDLAQQTSKRELLDLWSLQMFRCGQCAMCRVKEKTRELRRTIKKTVGKATRWLWEKVAAQSASRDRVRTMQSRFQAMLRNASTRVQNDEGSSFDGISGHEDMRSNVSHNSRSKEEKQEEEERGEQEEPLTPEMHRFAEALVQRWQGLEKGQREQRISLLERSLQDAQAQEEIISQEERRIEQRLRERSDLSRQLPTFVSAPECQDALQAMDLERVVEISVNVEFPNIFDVFTSLAMADIRGAIKAVIPEVLVMAVPRTSYVLKHERIAACLKLLNPEVDDYLDSCETSLPIMACTARISQRLYAGLAAEGWWPASNGSTRLKDDQRTAVQAMRFATEGSCLEVAPKDVETRAWSAGLNDITQSYIDTETDDMTTFERTHCPFVRSLIDMADGDDGLPVVADRIWMASLKAYAASVANAPMSGCPQVEPFATAYCAAKLSCIKDGQHEFDHKEAVQRANQVLDSNTDVLAAKDKALHLSSQLLGSKLNQTEAGRREQWYLLWKLVKKLLGQDQTWDRIAEGVQGEAHVNWSGALKTWSFAYRVLEQWLEEREIQDAGTDQPFSLVSVFSRMKRVYTSSICRPGSLVDIGEEDLGRLGAPQESAREHQMRLQAKKKKELDWAGWARVKVLLSQSEKSEKKWEMIKQTLDGAYCDCMCLQTGKKQLAAAKSTTCKATGHWRLEARQNATELVADDIFLRLPDRDYESIGQGTILVERLQKCQALSDEACTQERFGSCSLVISWETSNSSGQGLLSSCVPQMMSNKMNTQAWYRKATKRSPDLKLTLYESP